MLLPNLHDNDKVAAVGRVFGAASSWSQIKGGLERCSISPKIMLLPSISDVISGSELLRLPAVIPLSAFTSAMASREPAASHCRGIGQRPLVRAAVRPNEHPVLKIHARGVPGDGHAVRDRLPARRSLSEGGPNLPAKQRQQQDEKKASHV